MKKIYSILVPLAIAALLNNADAQDNLLASNLSDFRNIYLYDTENSTAKDAAVISMKVLRNFARSFKNVTGEKWYKVSDGFMAGFYDKGIETKVAYDLKGVFHCTLRTLNETQLPFDVRDVVKRKYYDFKILVVYEIKHDNTVYILKMENASTLKTLRIANGEIEVIADNTRG